MSKQTLSTLLLVLVILLVASGVATLLPLGAVRDATLGYSAWCSFAPVSTAVLLLAAGALWVIRQYIRTRLN